MPKTVKLAEYLFTRLIQLGVGAVHGVPGDYQLTLLDYVEPAGLAWVGSANELNAGYAADGYARVKGIGALITTFGVGELSAINAIAGAFAERSPVVHIVGTPKRDSQEQRAMIHHTMGDGEYRHYAQMATHVTVAQANLIDPRTATQQIDLVLLQCLVHSRPVYIEVPVDMVAAPVLADRLDTKITLPDAVPGDSLQEKAISRVIDKLHSAKQPMILIDGESRAMGCVEEIDKLVKMTKWPTLCTGFGKGLIDMSLPNVYGVHTGRFLDKQSKHFVDNCDLVVCFGPHYSGTNTYGLSAIPKAEVTLAITPSGIQVGGETLRAIPVKNVLVQVINQLDQSKIKTYDAKEVQIDLPDSNRDDLLSFSQVSPSARLRQDKLWSLMSNFIRPGDIVLGETGTAAYGVRSMPLPQNTSAFVAVTWLSIGAMLPLAQGAALAQRELSTSPNHLSNGTTTSPNPKRRTILFIGDGSFQMTCQELATMIRLDLPVIVFLLNNDGYTIERCIHGLKQKYNDISKWRYLKAMELFGAPEEAFRARVKTYAELEKVLEDEKLIEGIDGGGVRMVELILDRFDTPPGIMTEMINEQKRLEGMDVEDAVVDLSTS